MQVQFINHNAGSKPVSKFNSHTSIKLANKNRGRSGALCHSFANCHPKPHQELLKP